MIVEERRFSKGGRSKDYLRAIYELRDDDRWIRTKEIAGFLGVSPPTVSETLQRLSTKGLVKYKPYHGVRLTSEGLSEASEISKKETILTQFLVIFLKIEEKIARVEANRLLHSVSDEILAIIYESIPSEERLNFPSLSQKR